ncbi:hypothetical protein DDB_G0292670 [Dictyostelium discoideum AX4]|uniref:Uncharacterized protein n=1 Tax=Dictyostelium discoideum TaxID=44689 RepID=Q54CV8_DICDI|nr:hypothetical protein DDB_G0292670 [Dictyostelium discoideum AX4]EAL61138.1 hypothetical protein DDB_G0292670 [Dictyostelium discoideum AX4]|eukprot:XP_629562.1 hypothetical protein DDB_G0292670 [Dictyostelium discoideum AX4]
MVFKQRENFNNQDRLEILLKCLELFGEQKPKEHQQSELSLLLLEQNEEDHIQKMFIKLIVLTRSYKLLELYLSKYNDEVLPDELMSIDNFKKTAN